MTKVHRFGNRLRQRLSQHGFTMVELMVTLSVAGTLATLAVPTYQKFMQNTRLSDDANSMVATLSFARKVAMTEQVRVVACPSADQVSCDDTQSWGDGWIMFVDCNENGHFDADREACANATNERMLDEGYAADGTTLEVTGNETLRFEPYGHVLASRTFTLCGEYAEEARQVSVNLVGRSRATRVDTIGNC